MHDRLRVGDLLRIAPPRNNFPVVEGAERSVFVAGGIGITPFIPLAVCLNQLHRRWKLHYSVKTPDRAAHLDELQRLAGEGYGEVETNFDGRPGGRMIDLAGVIQALPPDAHVYCCGPEGMLDAFRRAASALPVDRVH